MDDREERQSTFQTRVDTEMSDIYLKTGFVLSVAQKGLTGFMDYSKKRYFERHILPMTCGKSCNVCTTDNFTPHEKKCGNNKCLCRIQRGRRVCPNGICGSIYEHLIGNNANVQYLNKLDPHLLSKSPDIIAESFMPYNQEKRIGGTYDISAFARFFTSNKYAKDYFGHGVNVPICIQKILVNRRKYAHSTITMGMTKENLDELIFYLLILLPATKKDNNVKEVDECMQILKEVKQGKKTFKCIVMEPEDDRQERTRKDVRSLIELGNEQQNNDFDMKTRSSTGYAFREPKDDTIKEPNVHQFSKWMPSVGLIYSSVTSGTIFRVGTTKAMTAWHVVKKITDPHGTNIYDFNKLNHPDIYITFGQATRRFRLKGLDIFTDKDLDISVLEFTDDASSLPPPLKLLPDEVFGVNDVAIIGYGHPSDNSKRLTHSAKILPRETVRNGLENTMRIIDLNGSCLRSMIRSAGNDPNSVYKGYNGYDNPDRFLFNSYVGPGASGSPLFSKEDPSSLKVVGVFTCGYPEFAYHLPQKCTIAPELTFEMATKMSSIYKSIESRDQNLVLDLFQ